MSAVILDFATHARRALRREADVIGPSAESRADKLRRAVLDECGQRNVPSDIAHYHAAMAVQILTRNPTRETSSLAASVVRQAVRAMEPPKNPPIGA